MIIKNYVREQSISGDKLYIIENARDVLVHMSAYMGLNSNGPDMGDGPLAPRVYIEHALPTSPTDSFYFVDFTDERGVRSRLKVTSYAYICNDNGKTIEKVNI